MGKRKRERTKEEKRDIQRSLGVERQPQSDLSLPPRALTCCHNGGEMSAPETATGTISAAVQDASADDDEYEVLETAYVLVDIPEGSAVAAAGDYEVKNLGTGTPTIHVGDNSEPL